MRPIFSALAIAALLAATMSAGTASAATETVSLGFIEDTGPDPAPLFEPAAVDNPVSFKVTYTAIPVQPIEFTQSVYCNRGSEHPGPPEQHETVTPPVSFTIPAPTGSESCLLAAQAETPIGGVFGTVRIEAEATRASGPQSTSQSAKKKKCKKGKRLKHGKCVKRGKKKHPHRH